MEITHQIPDERSLDRTRNAGALDFRSIGDNETEVRVRMIYQPETTIDKTVAAARAADARIKADLQRFKEFVESRGTATIGTWEGEGGSTHESESDLR